MDISKKETVVSIVRALWQKDQAHILDLKDGHFYLHLLQMLEQWDKSCVTPNSDEERLMCTKMFLQDGAGSGIARLVHETLRSPANERLSIHTEKIDYYGSDSETRIDDFLNFDVIVHGSAAQIDESKLELELAKIAVVLLGIGVLDKNNQDFLAAVFKVPVEKHYDVIAIIQSVVQAGSCEVALTPRVKEILCEPTDTSCQGARPGTPVYSALASNCLEPCQASTPKDLGKTWTSATAAALRALPSSPLRVTLLNSSLRDITSPLRGLSLDVSSSSSPLSQYAKSPQLIQKAILRQKETELRKLRRLMKEHIDRADELEYLLQDQTEAVSHKDSVIAGLEKKLQELQCQSFHKELKDIEVADKETVIATLKEKVQSLEPYKEQYLMLEKESSLHAEELRKLFDEIESLKRKNSEYQSMLESQDQLNEDVDNQGRQLNLLKDQLQQVKKNKAEREAEQAAMQETVNMLREQNAALRREIEDLPPMLGNTSGETMGVVLDIQVKELNSEIDEAKQEAKALQAQLLDKQKLIDEREDELQNLQGELRGACSKISEADKCASSQAERLEQLAQELCAVKQELEQLTHERSDLKHLNTNLQSELEHKTKMCYDADQKITTLEDLLAEKENCLSKLVSDLDQKDKEVAFGKDSIVERNAQVEELIATKESMSASIRDMSGDLVRKDDQILQLKQNLDEFKEDSEAKQTDLQTKLNEHRDQNAQALSKLQISHAEELSKFKANHLEEVQRLQQTLDHNQSELVASQTLCSERMGELYGLKAELEAVNNTLQSKTLELSEKDDYVVKLKQDCEKQLEEMEQNKCELQSLIEKLQMELDKMMKQFQVIENELVLKRDEVCQKEEQIKNLEQSFREKTEIAENNNRAALESLKAELEAVKDKDVKNLLLQIKAQETKAEKMILEKESDLEEVQRNFYELQNVNESLKIKLETTTEQYEKAEAQCQSKLIELSEKEKAFDFFKQDFEKQLSSCQQSNQTALEQLQTELKSTKEMNTQALTEKENIHKALVTSLKLQHEANLNKLSESSDEKSCTLAMLQKEVENKEMELEQLKADHITLQSSLKVKTDESEKKIYEFEKLVSEKEEQVASLKENAEKQLSDARLETRKAVEEIECKLEDAKLSNVQALSKQKQALEADMISQKLKLEKELQNLVQANRDASEAHKAAVNEIKEKAEEELIREQEEHVKTLDALKNDTDKEREGYLQSLLVRRQEAENLSTQLKTAQEHLHSEQEQSLNLKKDLEKLQLALDNGAEKHSEEVSLLSTKLKADLQKSNQSLEDLEQAYQKLQGMNKELQNQLDNNSLETSIEIKNLKDTVLEKESHISNLTHKIEQKDANMTDLQQALLDKASALEDIQSNVEKLTLSLAASTKNAAEGTNLIQELQHEVSNKEKIIAELKKSFEEQKASACQENQILIEQLELKYKAAQESELKTLSNEKAAHDAKLKELQHEKEQELQDWAKEKDCLQCKLDETTRQYIDAAEELKNYTHKFSEAEAQLSAMKAELEERTAKLSSYQNNAAVTGVELETMKSELKHRIEELCEKEEMIRTLKNSFTKKIKEIKEQNRNEQGEREAKFEEALKSEIEKAAEQQLALESSRQQLDELRDKYETKIAALQEEIATLLSKISHLEQQEKLYHSMQEKSQSLMEQKEEEVQQLGLKIERLEQVERTYQAQCHQNEECLRQKGVEAADLQFKLESYESQLDQRREDLSLKERKISEYESQLSQAQDCLMGKSSAISDLEMKVESYESQLQQNQECLKHREQEVTQCRAKLEQLEHLAKSLYEQHQACLAEKDAKIAELSSQIQGFSEIEKSHQSHQDHLQKSVELRDEKLADLQANIERLQEVNQSLQNRQDQDSDCLKEKEDEIQLLKLERGRDLKARALEVEETTAQLCKLKEELDSVKTDLSDKENKIVSEQKKHKTTYEKNMRLQKEHSNLKDSNDALSKALKIERDTSHKMKKRMDQNKSKFAETTVKLESMQKENKQYASEVNRLKTSLDFAERKLRECQKQLDNAGVVLLGDGSHFQKIISKSSDDSLEGSPDSIGSSRSLRSRSRLSSGSGNFDTNLNETILSGDVALFKRKTIANASELKRRGRTQQSTEDRLSICSAFSSQSTKSTTGLPVPGVLFATCANEPDGPEFEWDRLSELQRRNTMYLPHLKSAYPVEMQTVETQKLSDEGLRLSTIADPKKEKSESQAASTDHSHASSISSGKSHPRAGSGPKATKRHAPLMQLKEEISEASPPKQVRTAPNYHRPGPPTPGKQPRRVSGSFSPNQTLSPGSTGKGFGSPITRAQARLTPRSRARRSPRLRSLPAPSHALQQEERRQSVAFNIGFSPLAMRPPKQAGLVPKKKLTKPSSTTSKLQEPALQKFRKPLSTRNYLETGI